VLGSLATGSIAGATSPPTVPGLAPNTRASAPLELIPSGGSVPSLAQCAAAWNRGAPAVTRRWVVAHHPVRAVVQLLAGPGQSLCLISINFRANLALAATGLLQNGIVHVWSGSAVISTTPPTGPPAQLPPGAQPPKRIGTVDGAGRIHLA
jgi:hypothetical protein